MQFMDVYDRPDLLEAAENGCGMGVLGVFAQADTWDVHLFVLMPDGEGYLVEMVNVSKEDRGTLPSGGELVDALENGMADDSGGYSSLAEALDTIVQYGTLHTDNPEYLASLGQGS